MLLSAIVSHIGLCDGVIISSLISRQILTFVHYLDMYSSVFNGEKLRGVFLFYLFNQVTYVCMVFVC